MRRTAIYKDDLFLQHQPGYGHPESPDRLRVIYDALDKENIGSRFVYPQFRPVSAETLQLNHSEDLVRRVTATQGHALMALDPDTHTSPRSNEAACLAVGALTDGIASIVRREIDNAFCLVRPPGHHAERENAMGFCLYNNVAVAARWAMQELGLQRIMIIDWDLHHGNGTQESFHEMNEVLYLSVHKYPYYPGTGSALENGTDKGEGYTVNVPLPGGQGDFEYARIFNELIVPVARQYQPELILISCGFDICKGDPLGDMRVTPEGIAYMTRKMVEVAEEVSGGRLLVTLEGGYNLDSMRDGSLAVLAELSGQPIDCDWPVNLSTEKAEQLAHSQADCPSLEQALLITKEFWQI
ncbi:MAG: Acetoin utilization deacetylase AcuC [Candidatus Electronema aureum]|uniref:Acetoin utilization deacetylase AcuC n=1 Tax=Candidatus Electronema aureum TaxID=2005002 RepID=A0A521G1A4_9BACT|nr:MAG: Acetoin utilization deacetylase AcuC [Candidatus Electronema aureum]